MTIEAIAIGASAGGLHALPLILAALPADHPATIVVRHLPEATADAAAGLGPFESIRVEEARWRDRAARGRVHVAPAGYHLLIERDRTFSLSLDEPVHHCRPSIDVLFESAADVYGAGLIGVLLTGANEDGARGLLRILARGGRTIVQDPAEAAHDTMPRAAIAAGAAGQVLPLSEIGRLLAEESLL